MGVAEQPQVEPALMTVFVPGVQRVVDHHRTVAEENHIVACADLAGNRLQVGTAVVRIINAGDVIGTLRVWFKDVCVAQTDILSMSISKVDTMSTIFDGGVITDEESDKITSSFRTGVKIFVMLVAVVLVLSIGVAIYNAVIEMKRRKRRRNRRRSR